MLPTQGSWALGEKLRERLDHLEALAASALQSRDIEKTQATDTGSSADVSTPINIITQSLPALDASNESVSSLSALTPALFQHSTSQSDDSSSAPSIWESTTSVKPSLLDYDKYNDPSNFSVDRLSVAAPEDSQRVISQSYDSPLTPSNWDITTSIDPSLLYHDKHSDGPGPYSTIAIDCGYSSPLAQIGTSDSDPFNHGEVKLLNFGPSVTAANPYTNNLRIETVCNIAALYTLGVHVGLTEEMICAEKSLSPFFRSSVESADDMVKANTICTVQRNFKILKPDLRPGSEQITVDHHPYIDILPFPTLRKNLITHQEEIDEDGFFHDILTGLVCWGGAGIGRKDRQDSTGYASTGTPWDVRSWEARVWFLKKYWTLLGGEDGELVRQSEWWRSMRGDDTLHIEST